MHHLAHLNLFSILPCTLQSSHTELTAVIVPKIISNQSDIHLPNHNLNFKISVVEIRRKEELARALCPSAFRMHFDLIF